MAKKKDKRPSRVCIHYEHLLYDLDFMSNENAGIILKMVVWYSMGDERSRQEIERMKKHIDVLPDRPWLTSMYRRLFMCIDEDMEIYNEVCEKRKKAVEKRWEASKNIQMNTNVLTQNDKVKNTTYSSEENTNVFNSKQADTNEYLSNPIPSNPIQSNPIPSIEEEEDACEEERDFLEIELNSFVAYWNKAIAKAKKTRDVVHMKPIAVEDLPNDAQERIVEAVRSIIGWLDDQTIARVRKTCRLPSKEMSREDLAKWYMLAAIEKYSLANMKSRDSSFGTFNWFINYPVRIRKLFDGDIM